jgi:hypothetical protein
VIKAQEVVRENYSHANIVIAFNPIEQKFEVPDASIRRNPRYFQNISDVWKPDVDIFEITEAFTDKLQLKKSL